MQKARSLLAPSICSAGGGPTAFKGALPAAPRLARSAVPAARPPGCRCGGTPAAPRPWGCARTRRSCPSSARKELYFRKVRLPAPALRYPRLPAGSEVFCFHAIHFMR
ncbi:unnamed protein product [Coccothraustes coccothraustes]